MSDYKERMREEYVQLKDRYTKLHKMLDGREDERAYISVPACLIKELEIFPDNT